MRTCQRANVRTCERVNISTMIVPSAAADERQEGEDAEPERTADERLNGGWAAVCCPSS